MDNYEIILTNGTKIKHIPTIKDNTIFTNWLKTKNAYEKFIKIADLPKLSKEKNPEYFFTVLNWDKIMLNDEEENYWEITLDKWLIYISQRDWNTISSGIETNDGYEQELFNRMVIEKLNKINFNKLTNEQYRKLDEILKS